MKVVTISDTHNAHKYIDIPPCDLLIHAGDESFWGKIAEIENFVDWFKEQPAKHKVWVPGNHSVQFSHHWPQSEDWVKNIDPSIHILVNSDVTLDGVKIWGSPVTPRFMDWAWNVDRGAEIKKVWDGIPNDATIVVTHGPPFGILDAVKPFGESVGCEELRKAILRVKPKMHVFGHIHEGHGNRLHAGTLYVNASIMNERYNPVNLPQEFTI